MHPAMMEGSSFWWPAIGVRISIGKERRDLAVRIGLH
jgi:hypothetical protein